MADDLMRRRRDGRAGWMRLAAGAVRAGLAERMLPTWYGGAGNEDEHGGGVERMIDVVRQELGFAVRALVRRPGWAAIAVFTIALGIGANTAIFSVVDGVLLRPLSFPDPDELVRIGSAEEGSFGTLQSLSHPEMEAMDDLAAFSSVVAVRTVNEALTGLGPAEMVPLGRVTRGVLETFGMPPVVGRDLRPDEAVDPTRRVAVASHAFWTTRLGADPDVVGRTVTLGAERYEIVGVAPAGATWPVEVAFWVPGGTVEGDCWWGCSLFSGLARLAPGVSPAEAQQQLDALATNLQEVSPATQTDRGFTLRRLHEDVVGDVSEALWMLLGAVGLVLLIACANVAHLLLARGSARQGEFAVRSALGASRRRVLGGVLAESAVLGVAGAVLGLALAVGVVAILPRLAGDAIPRISEVGIDGSVLAFTLVATLLSIAVFGVVPGLGAARGVRLAGSIRAAGRGGTARTTGRHALVAAEVALSLVLLVGAGLLMRTFASLVSTDLGVRTERVTRFDLSLPDGPYEDADRVLAFGHGLVDRLEALPGVERVSLALGAPMASYSIGGSVRFLDRPEPLPGEDAGAAVRVATPEHFGLYGLEVVRGRAFGVDDRRGEPTAYVVNEAFVRRYFDADDDPIGEPVRMGVSFGYGREPGRIVGVVADVGTVGVGWEIEPEIYVPWEQLLSSFFTVSVATRGESLSADAVRGILADLDPDVPYLRFHTVEAAFAAEVAPTRFYLSLLGGFAVLALVLAAVGLYGVVSYSVSRRTREIGLRVAMGADRGEIVRLVLRQGLGPTVAGILLGLAIAWGAVRLLETVLYGVEPTDPATFAVVSLLLFGVAVGATWVPARRAARVEPVEALRAE